MNPLQLFFLTLAILGASHATGAVYMVQAGDVRSLHDAIAAANLTPDVDTIELQAGLYLLADVDEKQAALPEITSAMLIRGRHVELRSYGKSVLPLIRVGEQGHLILQALTLAEGNHGALINRGKAQLSHVQIVDQTSRGLAGIVGNYGDLELRGCTVSFNTIAPALANSGTIVNFGTISVFNTRLQGNVVQRKNKTLSVASGLLNFGTAHLSDLDASENEIANADLASSTVPTNVGVFVDRGTGKTERNNVRSHMNWSTH